MKEVKKAHIFILIGSMVCVFGLFTFFILSENKAQTVDTPIPDIPYSSEEESQISSEISSEATSSQFIPPAHFNEEDIAEIDAVVKKYGEGVSVYFEDIDSGNVYTYNQDEKYFIASLIKAPYCMYLYELASEGKCSLDQTFLFEEKHKREGTGKLKNMETPMVLTMRELMSYAILYSDNTAMKILLNDYPYTGYTEYAKKLGINNIEDVKYVVNGDICARDAGVYIRAIYNFIETNPHGEKLKNDMMKTTNPMITSQYPIARKYGWADLSFHDFGIVYAPHPYVIAICTNKDDGREEDYKLFREITSILEKKQQEKYEESSSQ